MGRPSCSPSAPGEPPLGDPSTARDEAEALPFLYDTYDLSGAVAEPGHYVFLEDPADTSTAVTTYEGLRDGTATALLIHTHDTHGVSQVARYDAVEPGDLVEWKQAADCFVRYAVTSAPAPAVGAVTRAFGVAWMTYAFTGCSSAIATATTAVSVTWGGVILPDLGGGGGDQPDRAHPPRPLPDRARNLDRGNRSARAQHAARLQPRQPPLHDGSGDGPDLSVLARSRVARWVGLFARRDGPGDHDLRLQGVLPFASWGGGSVSGS